ncbi:type II toxin-antitoxin system VapC family toxin [Tunicatimonas pelagia]|uniref:type II toxin-antitoxin system VapC family toxin n=1 Tax=Tunicatimonas pelagia TaxID=931531 RepID=UPI0026650AC2|nr:type II toxin-antitoxin system VapC family toxin [Tunicatimonas pelagia]WKN41834.1 type II toxin-antitoxin system VapC family toxin [Tunicatimonas pelagia]
METELSDIQERIASKQVGTLPITTDHLETLENLPYQDKHRDPFDRLIIIQAMTENMTLIFNDPHFTKYPVKLLW